MSAWEECSETWNRVRRPFLQRPFHDQEVHELSGSHTSSEQIEVWRYDEEELLQFIAAILEDSASLKFIELWEQEYNSAKKKAGLEPLADLIAKKTGLARG